MVEKIKNLLKHFKKKRTIEDYEEYRRAKKKEARKTIRKKKNESFRKFVTTINKNTDITYVWNKMSFKKRRLSDGLEFL